MWGRECSLIWLLQTAPQGNQFGTMIFMDFLTCWPHLSSICAQPPWTTFFHTDGVRQEVVCN